MKFSLFATAILMLGVSATPALEESVEVTSGDYTYVGLDKSVLSKRGLEKRCNCSPVPCRQPHADCNPGQCNCGGNYGCWSCGGGRMQCQPGPGSGVCWT